MKKTFDLPQIELLLLNTEDIIVTSLETNPDDNVPGGNQGGFTPNS